MTKKPKKKTVHWTKLPRAKLVSMVKRLELANAKLKTQLAEARETRLLNERQVPIVSLRVEDMMQGYYDPRCVATMPNPFMADDEATLAEAFGVVQVTYEPTPVPRNQMRGE